MRLAAFQDCAELTLVCRAALTSRLFMNQKGRERVETRRLFSWASLLSSLTFSWLGFLIYMQNQRAVPHKVGEVLFSPSLSEGGARCGRGGENP